jgi:ACR3 family arsenite efflux pump ArsB
MRQTRLRRIQVLIEVPVMLLVAKVVNASKSWYEAGSRSGAWGAPRTC